MNLPTPQDPTDLADTSRFDRLQRLDRSGEYVDACLAQVQDAVPRDVGAEPLVIAPLPPPSAPARKADPSEELATEPLAPVRLPEVKPPSSRPSARVAPAYPPSPASVVDASAVVSVDSSSPPSSLGDAMKQPAGSARARAAKAR